MELNHTGVLWALFLFTSIISGGKVHASADKSSRGLLSNTCDVSSGLFSKTRVAESDKSLNLSKVFAQSSTYSVTYSTSWSGKMSCTYGVGLDNVFYFTGFNNNPVYLHFSSSDGQEEYWIKTTAQISGDTKEKVNGIAGKHSISSYQTQYTVMFELLSSAPAGVSNMTKSTTSGVLSVIPAVMSGHGDGSNTYNCNILGNKCSTYGENVWDYMINDTASWSTSRYIAYEKLSVQFAPNQTTCNLTHDMTIKLPAASLDRLTRNGEDTGTTFRLPIECSDALAGTTSTRNINAWLSSHDILNDADSGTVIINDDSTAGGVGISLKSLSTGQDIVLSSGSSATNATTLLELKAGDNIEKVNYISLNAYYKVYNAAALTAGDVIATAQIMFGYD
ncbi:fimbrial protein [Pseudocitrobacter cyperus]|uniref:Fimbrial protein n=1 Tax=Pseudocitrobacter cyperus TaxID=3112843 RepID=A0ABV0HP42_9ENTR